MLFVKAMIRSSLTRAPVIHIHASCHVDQLFIITICCLHPFAGLNQWTTRGLLDFNLLFPQWPAAFPQTLGSFAPDPPRAAFANLKEGFVWSDAGRGFAITVQKVADCDSQVRQSVRDGKALSFDEP